MSVLLIPWIVLFAIFTIAICSIKRKWKLVTILGLFVLWLNLHFRILPITFASSDEPKSFSVLTFNIGGRWLDSLSVQSIAHLIIHEDADFVFVAEDFEYILLKYGGFIKNYFPYETAHSTGTGHYLLSKKPISFYDRISKKEHPFLYHYTVAVDNDSIHLYGCHLASNNYTEENKVLRPDSIKELNNAKQYVKNIQRASTKRQEQVSAILANVKPENRCIILGDFNDISGSAPLNKIDRAGFTDAWGKGGNGYGATIHHPLPYRIDHIFYNKGLKLKSIRKVDSQGLSDHDALVAEFWVE